MSIHLSLVCQQYSFDCTSIKTINNWKCIYWRFTCEKNVEHTLSDIVLSYKRVEIKITSTCSPFWITDNAFFTISLKYSCEICNVIMYQYLLPFCIVLNLLATEMLQISFQNQRKIWSDKNKVRCCSKFSFDFMVFLCK